MAAKLIDIGCNLMHESFDRDRAAVMEAAAAAGVSPLVITGTSVETSRAAADFAARHPERLYAAAGVHPHNAKSCGAETARALRELARRAEVIAIGECGLDYNRDFSPRSVQREWFRVQLELAAELKMPLFLHERDAASDFAAMMKEFSGAGGGFVVHCFTGGAAELETYLALGAYIGVTGWICDERRGGPLAALVRDIPPDRLLVETDAPFLLPRDLPAGSAGGGPVRKKSGRNEPRFLPHIVTVIARHLDLDPEMLAARTRANTLRFFRLAETERIAI
jgi:TatD DNase family protein